MPEQVYMITPLLVCSLASMCWRTNNGYRMERYNEGDNLTIKLLVGPTSQLRLNTNNGVLLSEEHLQRQKRLSWEHQQQRESSLIILLLHLRSVSREQVMNREPVVEVTHVAPP